MKDSGVDSLGMHLEVVEEEIRKKNSARQI
jgi:hypothetical protein